MTVEKRRCATERVVHLIAAAPSNPILLFMTPIRACNRRPFIERQPSVCPDNRTDPIETTSARYSTTCRQFIHRTPSITKHYQQQQPQVQQYRYIEEPYTAPSSPPPPLPSSTAAQVKAPRGRRLLTAPDAGSRQQQQLDGPVRRKRSRPSSGHALHTG